MPRADSRTGMNLFPAAFQPVKPLRKGCRNQAQGAPGCGGMGTAGGNLCTRGRSRASSPLSRANPAGSRLQFDPRAPLVPISMVSALDARLGTGCF